MLRRLSIANYGSLLDTVQGLPSHADKHVLRPSSIDSEYLSPVLSYVSHYVKYHLCLAKCDPEICQHTPHDSRRYLECVEKYSYERRAFELLGAIYLSELDTWQHRRIYGLFR